MAGWLDSWMPGAPVGPNGLTDSDYPGERLGLPASGVGSVAGFGRRLAALTIDWFIGYGIAAMFATPDPAVLTAPMLAGRSPRASTFPCYAWISRRSRAG